MPLKSIEAILSFPLPSIPIMIPYPNLSWETSSLIFKELFWTEKSDILPTLFIVFNLLLLVE